MRLPDEASDDEAPDGVPIGPVEVADALGLPEPQATRLHNALHRRGLWTLREAKRQPAALQGALQAALNMDVQLLMKAFADFESQVL